MSLRVGKGERATPGNTQQQPGFDSQVHAQGFDIRKQGLCGVACGIRSRFTSQGPTAAAAALLERDDQKPLRVKMAWGAEGGLVAHKCLDRGN